MRILALCVSAFVFVLVGLQAYSSSLKLTLRLNGADNLHESRKLETAKKMAGLEIKLGEMALTQTQLLGAVAKGEQAAGKHTGALDAQQGDLEDVRLEHRNAAADRLAASAKMVELESKLERMALVQTQLLGSVAKVGDRNAAAVAQISPRNIGSERPLLMPSVQTTADQESALKKTRKMYGGAGDKQHLGGFTAGDKHGMSPALWQFMMQNMTVKSFLDLGCG